MAEKPGGLAGGFFRTCLLLLGGVIALDLAVDVLRCIWLWLAIAGAVGLIVYVLIWWLRRRDNRW